MERAKILTDLVSAWPQVSVHPHRFGGREFRIGSAEVGHVHDGGVVDIPFPRAVRDVLVAERMASEHHWVPDSGWVTFRMRTEQDLRHALRLMRLSYLRYALKTAADPHRMIQQEIEELELSPALASLMENLVPVHHLS